MGGKAGLPGGIARLVLAAACAGCAAQAGFYDVAPIADPALAPCAWTRRYVSPLVYQESEFIRAYFEPGDPAAYRRAIPARFSVPPRPLIRVSVLDFYGMANGPAYLESEISVLVVNEGKPGWFVLTMPVTDGDMCAAGRAALGTPKVMRRITLARGADRAVGTSYAVGGRTPEFTLSWSASDPGPGARELLEFASQLPDLNLLRDRVVTLGGLPRPVVRPGEAWLDFPRDPGSLLYRLGTGRPLASYRGQLRERFSITPR